MLAHPSNSSSDRARADETAADRRDDDAAAVRVELWREPTQTGGRNEFDRVAERLRTLETSGVVDAAAVETWERFVDVSGGAPDDEVPNATLDRVGRLRRWAWQHGESVPFPEESRTAGRGRLGPPLELRRVPRAALVEFENGVVTNVTFADERTGCLTKRLEALAEREREPPAGEGREREPRERLRF